MAFPKYESYQDTGEDWLGEIPKHWQLLRTKNIFRLICEPAPDNNNEELLSVYSDIGVKPRRELEERGNKASTTDGYWFVKKGDVIVNKLLAWMGAIGVSDYDGVTSPAYDILRAYKPIDSKFYHYLFRNPICISKLKQHSKGIMEMRLRLYFDEFGNIKIPYPPLEDQKRIVEFLDRKTAEIDQAIAQKQRLIELLQEQKAIVINQAVTKGLNPDVSMHDSGFKSINKIPTHWKSKRLKFAVNRIYDCKNRTPEYVENGEYFVIRTSNVRNGKLNLEDGLYTDRKNFIEWTQKGQPFLGELVFTREAPAGEVAILPENVQMCLGQRMMGIKPNEKEVLGNYLLYFLQSQSLKEYVALSSAGSTVSHLRVGQVFDIPIAYPASIREQNDIAKFCAEYVKEIEKACSFIQNDIAKIYEFRQITIANAVTGKIKV
mgnify:CR=1 FL=1